MVVLQWIAVSRVVTSWQTIINLQVTSVQQIDSNLIVVLQWMAKSGVVARP